MTDCQNETCSDASTTTVRFHRADGELRSYCDRHVRHLLEMGVRFEGTVNPENPGEVV